ncbi:wax ester/triacylglycerol synthase family O-acyltransferase [Candidatus Sororendozoicomonas aggregata]|uniref:WS/DGAT/MGAT family O-acyltransferase n=1 Tax=Candidatus Sororendozoicomonas aggregata TaxID=3073239 RepID=UPI002ED370DB
MALQSFYQATPYICYDLISMKQLSALDTTFLNLETDTTPMHVGCVGIYDPSTIPGGSLDSSEFVKNFERKLAKLPVMRQRHVSAPMGIDYPYWISDPEFNLDYHIRHIALPKPGNWRQLCAQAARIHERPLDLKRAPWEVYVISGLDAIEGIPEGSFALVSKMHHALIDGVRGIQILAALHDLSPKMSVPKNLEPIIVDRLPSGIELLTRAALNMPGNLMAKARATTRHALPLLRNMAGILLSNEKMPRMAPKTRFNTKVTSHRVFDAVSFDLKEIKALRQLVPGSTINDVMVAIVSGAMRRYLTGKGEQPEKSLRAMLPMNVSAAGSGAQGNHISFMFPSIHTDIEGSVERLVAIKQENEAAKSRQEKHNGQMLMDSTHLLPTTLTHLVIDKAIKYNIANRMKPLFNTVITNVPGPQLPLYQAGAKMLAMFGAGICYDTVGLFHIIFSYNGNITISFTSCLDMMPDTEHYATCLKRAMAEMKKNLPTT